MKLLLCTTCWDIFKLEFEMRSCKCGCTKGKYLSDGLKAVVNGNGISLGILNQDLAAAMNSFHGLPNKDNLTAEDFKNANCNVNMFLRPHEGKSNPNTKVIENL